MDLVNRRSDLVNRESDLVNRHSDLVNWESDLVNQESDLVNRRSDIINRESDLVNRRSDLESDLVNCAFVVLIVLCFQLCILAQTAPHRCPCTSTMYIHVPLSAYQN